MRGLAPPRPPRGAGPHLQLLWPLGRGGKAATGWAGLGCARGEPAAPLRQRDRERGASPPPPAAAGLPAPCGGGEGWGRAGPGTALTPCSRQAAAPLQCGPSATRRPNMAAADARGRLSFARPGPQGALLLPEGPEGRGRAAGACLPPAPWGRGMAPGFGLGLVWDSPGLARESSRIGPRTLRG